MENFLSRHHAIDQLKRVVLLIEANNQNYLARHLYLLQALELAAVAGLPHGFRIDPKEPDWPVLLIDLPTGQVSWHLPAYPGEWDGHTTEEKYRRCREFCKQESD